MISATEARILFEEKMRWVEEQTGKNIKMKLMMSCGPDHADVIYEQMFSCFFSGMETQYKRGY